MIYLMTDECRGVCKIGYTANPQSRIKTFKTVYPFEMKFAGLMVGDKLGEKTTHEAFSHLRITGEWFKHDGSIVRHFMERGFKDLLLGDDVVSEVCIEHGSTIRVDSLKEEHDRDSRGLNPYWKDVLETSTYQFDGGSSEIVMAIEAIDDIFKTTPHTRNKDITIKSITFRHTKSNACDSVIQPNEEF
jgi:hypothetical protein